tara:strand:+ start:2470 stop:2970 length:501 start_codon:yes stop_codon:yes gene_type:complete
MTKIRFDLNVNNYRGGPQLRLCDNKKVLYDDKLSHSGPQSIEIETDLKLPTVLTVEHYGKNMKHDTKILDGKIVDDKGFSIEKIQIDNFVLQNEIYHFEFKTENDEVIDKNNYIGHNGTFIINIDSEHLSIWYYKMKKKLLRGTEAFDYEKFKSEIFQNDSREVVY